MGKSTINGHGPLSIAMSVYLPGTFQERVTETILGKRKSLVLALVLLGETGLIEFEFLADSLHMFSCMLLTLCSPYVRVVKPIPSHMVLWGCYWVCLHHWVSNTELVNIFFQT